jgi:hypothetical protein
MRVRISSRARKEKNMPDPLDRHARPGKHAFYGGEDPGMSRSQLRRIAAEFDGGADPVADNPVVYAKRAPGRKDPGLCKGTHWKGPHQPALQLQLISYAWKQPSCGWWIAYQGGKMMIIYSCHHQVYCTGCKKILQRRVSREQCPGYHPITPAERTAIDAEITRREELAAAQRIKYPRLRKPAITGPQGYRKKKKEET